MIPFLVTEELFHVLRRILSFKPFVVSRLQQWIICE